MILKMLQVAIELDSKGASEEKDFKTGDILSCIWGYDQTNVDFYLVVGITKKMVKIVELKSIKSESGFMCGEIVPAPCLYKSGQITKHRVTRDYKNNLTIKIGRHWAHKWDGTPQHATWYA